MSVAFLHVSIKDYKLFEACTYPAEKDIKEHTLMLFFWEYSEKNTLKQIFGHLCLSTKKKLIITMQYKSNNRQIYKVL